MSATHPLALKDSLLLKDLADQPLVLADQDQSLGHIRALFAAQGLIANIVHRTASLEVMRSYAANGLGIGLSYTNPAPRHSPDGTPLVTRPLSDAGAEPVVLAHLAASSTIARPFPPFCARSWPAMPEMPPVCLCTARRVMLSLALMIRGPTKDDR